MKLPCHTAVLTALFVLCGLAQGEEFRLTFTNTSNTAELPALNPGSVLEVRLPDESASVRFRVASDRARIAGARIRCNGGVEMMAESELLLESSVTIEAPRVTVRSEAGTKVGATIRTRRGDANGGVIHVLGKRVEIRANAVLDASGEFGGGTVLIGGDYQGANALIPNAERTIVEWGASIRADALGTGDGGKVVIWSDARTRFHGAISARGGAECGNGGFAEISSKGSLDFEGTVSLAAARGALGKLLLDPRNIVVANGGIANLISVDQFADDPTTDYTISPTTLAAAAANVVLQANTDIVIQNAISLPNVGARFTAQAGRSIILNANITTSGGDVTLIANEDNAAGVVAAQRDPGAAVIAAAAGTAINAGTGNVLLQINPGSGRLGTAADSGAITVSRIIGNAVYVNNNGPDLGSIVRSDSTSLITAGSLAFRTSGGISAIGSAIAPMRISATNLEANTGSGGAHFVSPTTGVTIGGAASGGPGLIVGGPLNLTANGSILSTEPLIIGGSNVFTVTAANSDIALAQVNTFSGDVRVGASGSGSLRDVTLRDSNAINLPAMTVGRHLSVTASGNISDFGNITVGSNAAFVCLALAADILLNDVVNVAGTMALLTTGPTANATVNNNSGLRFGLTQIGGDLFVNALGGDITQSSSVSVDGTTSLVTDPGRSILLPFTGNTFTGPVTLLATNGTLGNVTIGDSGYFAIQSGLLVGGDLAVTAGGPLTNGGPVNVGGNATFTTTLADGDITLSDLNVSGAISLNTAASNSDAQIVNAFAVNLGACNVGGNLSVIAGSHIVDSGNVVVGGDSAFIAGNNSSILLDSAGNSFVGALQFSAAGVLQNVVVNSIGPLAVGSLIVSGGVSVTAGGNITQSGSFLIAASSSFTAANGASILLGDLGNNFGGPVSFGATSGLLNDVVIANSSALALGALSVGGNLSATSVNGAIADDGALMVVGNSVFTVASGNSVVLDSAANNFGGSVTFATGGDSLGSVTVVDTTAFNLQANLAVAGDLNVTAGGNLTDLGPVSVGGNAAFRTTPAGADIVLDQLNVSGAVALNTMGAGSDATIVDVSGIQFGTCSVSGNLSATCTAGIMTQTGTLFVGGTTTFSVPAANDILLILTNQLVRLALPSGRNVTMHELNTIELLNVNLTGALNLSAGGTITLTRPMSAGSLVLNGTMNLGSPTVNTVGDQTYNGAVLLTTNSITLTGADVTFPSTVNGARNLDINASGNTTFSQSVGNTTRLTSLTTRGGGLTQFGAPIVRTVAAQLYEDAVYFGNSSTVTTLTGLVSFASAVTLNEAASVRITSGPGAPLYIGGDINGTPVGVRERLTLNAYPAPVTIAGTIGSSIDVIIIEPPVITVQPQSQTVATGSDVALSVKTKGTLPMGFQWRRGVTVVSNVVLSNHTSILNLPNIQTTNAGTYTVTITNEATLAGVVSSGAIITVLAPPLIVSQPTGTNVALGLPVTFRVIASGAGPFTYQWRLNGVNIPGATNSVLTLPSVRLEDGGSYTVVVANRVNAITSDPALLVITLPQLLGADSFAARETITNASGMIAGTNTHATREAGEPNHANSPGGKSVWYSWRAPANGIATFTTRGSSFDTLLAAYTGTQIVSLVSVAANDDAGGFFTSAIRFNAVNGTRYQIAIDGFGGASGNYVLTWDLESTAQTVPVITSHPISQTVLPGASANFSVTATGAGLTYQWFFNGAEIPGARGRALSISSVDRKDIGTYVVIVTNSVRRTAESDAALLEIGRFPNVRSRDKLAGSGSSGPGLLIAAQLTAAAPSVSAGVLDTQILNNTNSTTESLETNHCGSLGGVSRWFDLTANASGTFMINTIGTGFDTVLAVYTGNTPLEQRLVACDNDSGSTNGESIVRFPAVPGTTYHVAVDGVSGQSGAIQLNWGIGVAPTNNAIPFRRQLRRGDNLVLNAPNNGLPAPEYQWLIDGDPIKDATNSVLLLARLNSTPSGIYSVVVSNFIGAVTGEVATLIFDPNYMTLAESTFDQNAESWTVIGDATSPNPTFAPNNGNPGGHISANDLVSGIPWFWVAPAKFLGNRSNAYGGLLEFNLRTTRTDTTFNTNDVSLAGGGLTLLFNTSTDPGSVWNAYRIPLHEGAGWRRGALNGPTPTQQEMLRVLGALTQIRIRGEFAGGPDTGYLDNVALLAPLLHAQTVSSVRHRVEWPVSAAGFRLESSLTLQNPTWIVSGVVPATLNGLNLVTNFTVPSNRRFYRLVR